LHRTREARRSLAIIPQERKYAFVRHHERGRSNVRFNCSFVIVIVAVIKRGHVWRTYGRHRGAPGVDPAHAEVYVVEGAVQSPCLRVEEKP
jgi:hypothetical protein